MIALHPEATDDPATLRWVVPPGTLPLGIVTKAPDAVAALLADGILARLVSEPAALLATLAPGHDWRTEGARVRTAFATALDLPGWETAGADADDALARVAAEVLTGPTGDYVRSHGGALSLTGVHDGVVTLAADGTCSACPALDFTLQLRVAAAIRRTWPGLVDVRVERS